jgi:hypothetical protein
MPTKITIIVKNRSDAEAFVSDVEETNSICYTSVTDDEIEFGVTSITMEDYF